LIPSYTNTSATRCYVATDSGSHAVQTAKVMKRFEAVILERKPDVVLVYGDVNSTLAATLVCSKLLIRVGHVEAGLRSFDRAMQEEINRIVTDQLADLLFTPAEDGDINLQRRVLDSAL
jgi:UDP-N-acetylglucosamine 2-epimerase (non-hydrolysing)